jgi:hypothetical protein
MSAQRQSARSKAAQLENDLELPSSTQSAPRKQGRQGTIKGPSAQPVKKKPKENLQTTPEKRPTRTKKTVPPRSPLPQRINRVIHPGKPAMPRPKRTSAEVTEAKAKKAELLVRLEELERQKKIALAEMELDEEDEDMEEERTAVRHLKDLQNAENEEINSEPKDDRLEEFPMDEDEPLGTLDDEDESLDTEDDDSKPDSVTTKPVSVWVLKPSFITNLKSSKQRRKRL